MNNVSMMPRYKLQLENPFKKISGINYQNFKSKIEDLYWKTRKFKASTAYKLFTGPNAKFEKAGKLYKKTPFFVKSLGKIFKGSSERVLLITGAAVGAAAITGDSSFMQAVPNVINAITTEAGNLAAGINGFSVEDITSQVLGVEKAYADTLDDTTVATTADTSASTTSDSSATTTTAETSTSTTSDSSADTTTTETTTSTASTTETSDTNTTSTSSSTEDDTSEESIDESTVDGVSVDGKVQSVEDTTDEEVSQSATNEESNESTDTNTTEASTDNTSESNENTASIDLTTPNDDGNYEVSAGTTVTVTVSADDDITDTVTTGSIITNSSGSEYAVWIPDQTVSPSTLITILDNYVAEGLLDSNPLTDGSGATVTMILEDDQSTPLGEITIKSNEDGTYSLSFTATEDVVVVNTSNGIVVNEREAVENINETNTGKPYVEEEPTPDPEPEPVTPVTPDNPDTPDTPDNPDTPETTETTYAVHAPQTGGETLEDGSNSKYNFQFFKGLTTVAGAALYLSRRFHKKSMLETEEDAWKSIHEYLYMPQKDSVKTKSYGTR